MNHTVHGLRDIMRTVANKSATTQKPQIGPLETELAAAAIEAASELDCARGEAYLRGLIDATEHRRIGDIVERTYDAIEAIGITIGQPDEHTPANSTEEHHASATV